MSRRPYLAMVLLCLGLAVVRMAAPASRSNISVTVRADSCRVGICHSAWGAIRCSQWRTGCGETREAGDTLVSCVCQNNAEQRPRGCIVKQSRASMFVPCGRRVPLDVGGAVACHCEN